MPDWQVIEGDCVEQMAAMGEESVDAVVCDPPYGLEFMGKSWDRLGDVGQASHQGIADEPGFKGFRLPAYNATANVKCQRCGRWKWSQEATKCQCGPLAEWPNVKAVEGRRMQEWHEAWAVEALRVLKPGGHLLAFGGTRTYHRLACAIEDAGFEIRDTIAWMYGQGFPKSLNPGCRCGDGEASAEHDMRPVLDADLSAAVNAGEAGGEVLFAGVSEPSASADLLQRATAPEGRSESGVEGRHHVQAAEGQPCGRTLRAGADVGASDGADGRLRDGASARHGADGGASADTNGVRPSSGPSTAEQHVGELGAVADEPGSQAGGGWPLCPRCGLPVGLGTALKPAHEPIVVARKPLAGTVAANVLAHGTGALNVDGCRIGTEGGTAGAGAGDRPGVSLAGSVDGKLNGKVPGMGRWPANVVLDGEAAARLDPEGEWSRFFYVCGDESTGAEPTSDGAIPAPERSDSNSNIDGSGSGPTGPSRADTTSTTETRILSTTISPTSNSSSEDGTRPTTVDSAPPRLSETASGDALDAEGGNSSPSTPSVRAASDKPCASPASASTCANGEPLTESGTTPTCAPTAPDSARAFYCAKASSAERNAGLDAFEEREGIGQAFKTMGDLRMDREQERRLRRNVHPTVKPIDLMRWLVRLVTPPGGLVLDSFTGSGTTGAAAMLDGFRFVGIEREAEYAAIARARIAWWAEHPDGVEIVKALEAERTRAKVRESGQMGLFGA